MTIFLKKLKRILIENDIPFKVKKEGNRKYTIYIFLNGGVIKIKSRKTANGQKYYLIRRGEEIMMHPRKIMNTLSLLIGKDLFKQEREIELS